MTFFMTLALRSSIVLVVGLAAAALLRKQPAALRHSVIAAALLLAAAQPAINRAIPALMLPPIAWKTPAVASEPEVAVETTFATDATVVVDAKPPAQVDWSRILLAIWLTGIVASLATLFTGMAWLTWLQSRSRAAGAEWIEIEEALRAKIGGRRLAHIAITRHPALIVTWGVVSPAILLPVDADTWSRDRKQLVVAHELAHLRRRDWLTQVIAEIARSINWFNPLFWIACAQLRGESEHASDDLVLDTGVTGTSYASHLVDLARNLSAHGRTWLPAPSIARPSTLERRVRAMLNPQLNRRPVSRVWQFALMALLCAIALPIAAAAQATGTPGGKVTDRTGRPLADATLRLTPANGGAPIETRSNENGDFQFPQIAAGDYMLAVIYPGFSGSRQRLSLNGGATTIQMQVQVGTLRERVTVEGAPGGGPDAPRTVQEVATPAPPACSANPTGGQIIPPMKIRDVRPVYRQQLRDNRVEGEVLMRATIGTDGKVRGVEVIAGGNADLEDEALAAVAQWQFTATYLNCEPIEVQMYVTVVFKLSQ